MWRISHFRDRADRLAFTMLHSLMASRPNPTNYEGKSQPNQRPDVTAVICSCDAYARLSARVQLLRTNLPQLFCAFSKVGGSGNTWKPLLCHWISIIKWGNLCRTMALPGIWIVWLQPCCSRTTGGIVEMGEVLIKPLSALRVRLPLTRTSQLGSRPSAKVIQQQLEYLAIRQ